MPVTRLWRVLPERKLHTFHSNDSAMLRCIVCPATAEYRKPKSSVAVMKKEKYYSRTHFKAAVIEEASKVMDSLWTVEDRKIPSFALMSVSIGNETWSYDNLQELLGDWDNAERGTFSVRQGSRALDILFSENLSSVTVQSPSREEIQRVFNVFQKY